MRTLDLSKEDFHSLGIRVLSEQLGDGLVGKLLTNEHWVFRDVLYLGKKRVLETLWYLLLNEGALGRLWNDQLHQLLDGRVQSLGLCLLATKNDRDVIHAVRLLANIDEVLQERVGHLTDHQLLTSGVSLALRVEGWVDEVS